MRAKECVQWLLVAGLIVALGVPPGAWTAHAQQQEGPAKAAPPQQSEPTKPPTGQQNGPQGQAPAPQVAIAVESNVVNVDAVVTDHEGKIGTGWNNENFYVPAVRIEKDIRQESEGFDQDKIESGVEKLLSNYPHNRLVKHLAENCCLTYNCPAARNFFMGR